MEATLTLQYANEDDRAYGLAGMAISAAALDALDSIAYVTLDAPADEPMVSFSHSYYYAGAPSLSPKTTWDHLMRNFHLTSAMALSNIYARALVRRHAEVPDDVLASIHDTILAEAADSCSLEADEAEELYGRLVRYTRNIFANPRLHPAIDSFARVISLRRMLSGREIADELALLQLL